MLLSKEIAVYINLTACKFKQYIASMLKRNQIDLTPEQFMLIDLLWNQGPMSQQLLADTMQKDKNSITKLVDALEKKELIQRERNSKDRRSNTIITTAKANKLKQEAKITGIAILEDILVGISKEELRSFLTTLNKMSDNISAVTASKTDSF